MEKIMSVDAETDGLWGDHFAIAAIVYDEKGKEIDKFSGRLPDYVVKNEWVIDNVLPCLVDIPLYQYSDELLLQFAWFYLKHRDNCATIWHMGHVVEAYLFRKLVEKKFIGEWDAPYCPVEISSLLSYSGYSKPDSVDSYVRENDIKLSGYGSTHNPLYDCEVAAMVYFHLKHN